MKVQVRSRAGGKGVIYDLGSFDDLTTRKQQADLLGIVGDVLKQLLAVGRWIEESETPAIIRIEMHP